MRRARFKAAPPGAGRAPRAVLLLAVLAGALSGRAVAAQESDWPCQQRLVPTLEAGQMWGGPPLDGVAGAERSPEIVGLARELASVELPQAAMEAKVKDFAGAIAQDQRVAGLSQLFVVSLADLNLQRDRLIAAIRRYTTRQQQLAARIGDETRELDAAQRTASPDATRIAELQASRDWDLRVHTDRQRSLREVCDQPVRVEQRAFAVARAIQGELP